MTQLPATLPQQGGGLAKQRVPVPPGGQFAAGPKGQSGGNTSGLEGAEADVPQFTVPDRIATTSPVMPVNAAKPVVPNVLPEIEQQLADGSVQAELPDGAVPGAAPSEFEPRIVLGDTGMTSAAGAAAGGPDVIAPDRHLPVAQALSEGRLAPAVRPQPAVASLAAAARQSGDGQVQSANQAAAKSLAAEGLQNAGRVEELLHKLTGTGLDRAAGSPVDTARFQTILSARIDARRQMQSTPLASIKSDGAGEAKMEAMLAARAEIKVTVVHQETHFGAAPLQDMQLDAGRSGRSNAIVQPGPAAAAPGDVSFGQSAPLRVLHLHLEPAELGGVVVKMNMKGDALTVQIQPQLMQTASMLRSDSAALNAILQAAGVLADGATVQISDPSSNSNSTGSGMWSSNQGADQSGSAQRGDPHAGGDQKAGANKEHDDAGQGGHDEQDDTGVSGARNELYL